MKCLYFLLLLSICTAHTPVLLESVQALTLKAGHYTTTPRRANSTAAMRWWELR